MLFASATDSSLLQQMRAVSVEELLLPLLPRPREPSATRLRDRLFPTDLLRLYGSADQRRRTALLATVGAGVARFAGGHRGKARRLRHSRLVDRLLPPRIGLHRRNDEHAQA